MKIWPNELSKHLDQSESLPVLMCFYGEEPLLSIESVDKVISRARDMDFEIARFHVDHQTNWSHIQGELGGMSLFGSQKLVFLQVALEGKLPDKWADNVQKLIPLCAPGSHLLIQLGALNSKQTKAKWLKHFEQDGLVCLCKTPKDQQLHRWIRNRLDQQSIKYEDNVVELLAYRCNGNLLAAKQEIDILKLAYQGRTHKKDTLTLEMTREICSDHARFTAMDLKDACLAGHHREALNIFYHLQAEMKSNQIFSLVAILQREIERLLHLQSHMDKGLTLSAALKREHVLPFLEKYYKSAFTHITNEKLSHLVELSDAAELAAKGASYHSAWQQLAMLVSVFASRQDAAALMPYTRDDALNQHWLAL